MFGSKTKTQQTSSSTMTGEHAQNANQGISILAEGCLFQGKMFLRGTARISGRVEGTVTSNHVLVIEPSAKINGQINGVKILVCGQIDGQIAASELVHLTSTAKLEGDIQAPRFIVDDGAVINGRLETKPNQAHKQNSKPTEALKKAG